MCPRQISFGTIKVYLIYLIGKETKAFFPLTKTRRSLTKESPGGSEAPVRSTPYGTRGGVGEGGYSR